MKFAESLAWDWVNSKLYWTDSGTDEIGVIDPTTGYRITLIFTGRDAIPRGIVANPSKR